MGVERFCVGAFLLVAVYRETTGLYENNPFLSKVVPPVPNVVNPVPTLNTPDKLKQSIQQIAVVLPSGAYPQNPQTPAFNNSYQPGTILINVPAYYPINSQQLPIGVTQPPLPHVQPPVRPTQPPRPPVSPTQPPKPSEPGHLNKGCLAPRGQFPSAKCNTFLNCWDGVAIEQFCPVGLAFNPAGFCDYAYNVDCKGKPYAEIAVPQSVAPGGPPIIYIPDIIAPPERLTTSKPPTDPQSTQPTPPSYLPPGSVTVNENLKKRCLGERGLFPSDYCNKYVNCWDGNVLEQECPPGLLFSYKGYCDHPHNVDCYNRIYVSTPVPQPPASPAPPTNLLVDNLQPKPPQNVIPPTHPTYRPPLAENGLPAPPPYVPLGSLTDKRLRKKCLGERGLFPSDYCNRFVNCWDRFAVEQDCPAGLFFSDKGYCDYPYNVNCHNRTIISTPVPQPPASTAPPTNTQPDSLKPKPTQPSPPTYRPPPPPLDSFITLPTKKPSADTTPAPPPYVPPGVLPGDKLKKKCLRPRGQFPSDTCNKYVNCWDGFVVEQDCPPGLLFSDKGYCDYAYNVNCNKRVIITLPLPQPAAPQTGQHIIEPDKQVVSPSYQPFVQHPGQEVTQVPPYVTVGQQPESPVVTHPTHTSQPSVQPGLLPVDPGLKKKCLGLRGQFTSDSCHKYIDCWDEFAVEHDCPPGLLFSEKGYCDHPYNVNCQNRTVTKTAPEPACPAAYGTFRDKSNCSRFYTCAENVVAVKYECPAGLNFNDVIGVCDYAYRVDCTREPFVYQQVKKADLLEKMPASLMDVTAECTPGRVFRLNPECTSAALCRNSVTEVIHCPAGLAYDAPSDRCVPLQLARCQDI